MRTLPHVLPQWSVAPSPRSSQDVTLPGSFSPSRSAPLVKAIAMGVIGIALSKVFMEVFGLELRDIISLLLN